MNKEIICSSCGEKVESGHYVCPKCGHVLLNSNDNYNEEVHEAPNNHEYKIKPKSNKKPGVLVAKTIVALFLIAIFVGGYLYTQNLLVLELENNFAPNGNKLTLMSYIFIAVELVVSILLAVPNAITGSVIRDSRNYPKVGATKFAKGFSIFLKIIAILALLGGLGYLGYTIYLMFPYFASSFGF